MKKNPKRDAFILSGLTFLMLTKIRERRERNEIISDIVYMCTILEGCPGQDPEILATKPKQELYWIAEEMQRKIIEGEKW